MTDSRIVGQILPADYAISAGPEALLATDAPLLNHFGTYRRIEWFASAAPTRSGTGLRLEAFLKARSLR